MPNFILKNILSHFFMRISLILLIACTETTVSNQETIYGQIDMKQIFNQDQMMEVSQRDQMIVSSKDQSMVVIQDQAIMLLQDQMIEAPQDQMMMPIQDQMPSEINQDCLQACQSINDDCLSNCQNNQVDQAALRSACLQVCDSKLTQQFTNYNCPQKLGIISTLSPEFQQLCNQSAIPSCLSLCLETSTCMDDLCTTPLSDTYLLVNHCYSVCENNPSSLTNFFSCEDRLKHLNRYDATFNDLCAMSKFQPENQTDACMRFAECAQDQCEYYTYANLFELASTCLVVYNDADLYFISDFTCTEQVQHMSDRYENFRNRCDQMMNMEATELSNCQTECELLDLCADRYCQNRTTNFYDDCVQSCLLTPTLPADLSSLLSCGEKVNLFNATQPSNMLMCDFSGFVIGPGVIKF
jgi:hypothetical protein